MKFKSETQGLLKSFITFVHTQFNCQVKIIRSDNGLEFISLQPFLSTHGILLQNSCPYTPQQNGVVERKHRHLFNVGRALRFQANLPLKFWGESLLTATYLINRLPTLVLRHKSPYELLYGKSPAYSHLRAFGCLCYATNLQPLTKFSPRARRCIFVGYPSNQKAYRVYDLTTRQFFTSRDVIFHENTFPFFNHTSDNSPPQSSLPPIFPESNDSLIPQTLSSSPLPPETSVTPLSPSSSKSSSPQSSNPTQSSPFLQTNTPAPILRRNYRPRQSSVLLCDFHCVQVGMSPLSASTTKSSSSRSGTQYPLSSFISYQSLSPSHQLFVNTITSTLEPTTYEQALSNPKWCKAMRTELTALENQKT